MDMDNNQLLDLMEQYERDGKGLSTLISDYRRGVASGKTPTGLNQWVLTDKPTMHDFNEDNRIIDAKLRELDAKNGDLDSALQQLRNVQNRIYEGVDLTEKFAGEIAGDSWAWIQSRIRAGNYNGVNVGDFIPFTAAGNTLLAEVAGINTYTRYGDQEVGNHIDFISRDCWPETMGMNRVNYNNGTTASPSPWLASDLHARLNSLQASVPNSEAANPAMLAVDYRTTGLFNQLPAALRAVIVQKRALLPTRFTAGALLTDDNSWAWQNAGLLWLPSEMEVYGANMWGNLNPVNPGFNVGGFVQYPIFANNMKRVKGAGHGGARATWWLLSARGGASTHFASVTSGGIAYSIGASTALRVPVCFRVA